VNGSIVDLEQIDVPTCIIYAKKDQIVPHSSIVPLQKMIKNSTLIEVEGGHAAYLISPSSEFQQQYKNWLKTALDLK
jgi:polyhydroxyalkanoate synthase